MMFEFIENVEEVNQNLEGTAQTMEMESPRPERLESNADNAQDMPPTPVRHPISFKGSVEVSARKTELENAKNRIQAEIAAKRLAEQLKKEEESKKAYREFLYGKGK